MEDRNVGLRPLLLGPPLTERGCSDVTAACLARHMSGLVGLLPQVYGDSTACAQAVEQVNALVKEPESPDVVVCKRVALLFAMHKEKEVAKYFVEQERECGQGGTFAKDMRDRVLPFLLPRFLKNSCQTPDSMLMLAVMLHEMWEGEKLGNWPRGRTHHDAAIRELHQGAHGKRGRAAA